MEIIFKCACTLVVGAGGGGGGRDFVLRLSTTACMKNLNPSKV